MELLWCQGGSNFRSSGNGIKRMAFDGVVKSLRSVGRLGKCDKILRAMEEGGFLADASMHGAC